MTSQAFHKKKNILILEDEPGIIDSITYALKTEGFLYEACALALEAKSILSKKKFDLLILDLGLPDKNGIEFLKEVRKNSLLPVIILTAKNSETDRVLGLEMGADDYVAKPFSPRELVARIRAVLRRFEVEKPDQKTTKVAHFDIDEEKKVIFYLSKPLLLSSHEFNLLKFLISKPERVFSREQLIEAVWEDPLSVTDRAVDAHIKNIRNELKKIKADKNPIETRRGFGYLLKGTL